MKNRHTVQDTERPHQAFDWEMKGARMSKKQA